MGQGPNADAGADSPDRDGGGAAAGSLIVGGDGGTPPVNGKPAEARTMVLWTTAVQ
jgi:hypothetical protein